MAIHDKDETNIHCHIVIQNDNSIRFSALKAIIPYGDIEKQRGKNSECYEYCLHRDAKSKETEKIEYDESCIKTNIQDIETWKLLTNESGSRSDLIKIYQMIENGCTDAEIRREFPAQYIMYSKQILQTRQDVLREKYGDEFRQLDITYIYGSTGTGKTETPWKRCSAGTASAATT